MPFSGNIQELLTRSSFQDRMELIMTIWRSERMFTQKLNVNDTNSCKRNSFISFFVHFVMNIKALLNGIFCDFLNPGFCGVSL